MVTPRQKPLVAIDARVVIENQGHGIARYTEELVLHCMREKTNYRFVLLVNKKSPFLKMGLPENFSVQVIRTGWLNFLGPFELALTLRRLKPALFHSPSFMVPFFSSTPLVVTIHDLNHVVLSQYYFWWHKLYYNLFLPRVIKRAQKVITVSQFSKQEIVRFFKHPKENVAVIYNGVSPKFIPRTKHSQKDLEDFREKYELPENFILSVGNRKPHKNIRRLVEAYCKLTSSHPLVLLSDFDSYHLQIAGKHNKRHLIHYLRYVKNEDLPYLYSLAKVFVYPSLYEGFGLPPLEAAACGVPIVASKRSSLPEILQDAAYFVNPEDSQDIANAIRNSLTESLEQDHRIQRGFEVVKQYTWESMSVQILKVYQEVLSRSAQPVGSVAHEQPK